MKKLFVLIMLFGLQSQADEFCGQAKSRKIPIGPAATGLQKYLNVPAGEFLPAYTPYVLEADSQEVMQMINDMTDGAQYCVMGYKSDSNRLKVLSLWENRNPVAQLECSSQSRAPFYTFTLDLDHQKREVQLRGTSRSSIEIEIMPLPVLIAGYDRATVLSTKRVSAEWADGDTATVDISKRRSVGTRNHNRSSLWKGTVRFPEGNSALRIDEDSSISVVCREVSLVRPN